MAPTRTHRDRPRPSGRPQPGSVGRLTKNKMHVHTLYMSSERVSANVPRQSFGYANQSLVYLGTLPCPMRPPARLEDQLCSYTSMDVSPRCSRRSPALQPGLGAAFPPAEVRDQALSAFRTESSDLRGHCTVRRRAEKIPAVCRIALPSLSKMMIITLIVDIQKNESFVVHAFRGTRRDSTHRGENIKRRKKTPKYFLDHPCLPLFGNTSLLQLKRFPSSEQILKEISHTTGSDASCS